MFSPWGHRRMLMLRQHLDVQAAPLGEVFHEMGLCLRHKE